MDPCLKNEIDHFEPQWLCGRDSIMQNKANVKMGKMTISIATLKAYAKKQRTTTNERYSKQTQSKPISNAQTACPACRATDSHGLLAPPNDGWRNTDWKPVPRTTRPSLSRTRHALSRVEGSRECSFCRGGGAFLLASGGNVCYTKDC